MTKPRNKTYIIRVNANSMLEEKIFEQMLGRLLQDGRILYWEKLLTLNAKYNKEVLDATNIQK